MAGAHLLGGKRDIAIAKKSDPTYSPIAGGKMKIDKQSIATLAPASALAHMTPIVIGIRVKKTETVQFQMKGMNGTPFTLTPQANPGNNPDARELETVLGVAADEQWLTYDSAYGKDKLGTKFDTELVLSPFECHDSGFRVFVIAVKLAGQSFVTDHFVYGISVLPGKDNAGHPIDSVTRISTPKPKKRPASKKTKKKSKKK
jgi:hypothetical protein